MPLRLQIEKMLGEAAGQFLAIPAVSALADVFEHRLTLARIEFSHESRVAFFARPLDGLAVGSGCHHEPAEALLRCIAETLERRSIDAVRAQLFGGLPAGVFVGSAAHSDPATARMNACLEFEERRTIANPYLVAGKLHDATDVLGASKRPMTQAVEGEIEFGLHFAAVFTPRSLAANQFGAKVAGGADLAVSGAYSEFLQISAKAAIEQEAHGSLQASDEEKLFARELRRAAAQQVKLAAPGRSIAHGLDLYTVSPIATAVEGWHAAICTGRVG